MMDKNKSENCPIFVFMAAVNDWLLLGNNDEEVDKAAMAKLVSRSHD